MKNKLHHVVIIGGGFGGLYAAQSLNHTPVKITLIDMRNFHLFQPLLYQVATGGLSPGDIASPLRAVLAKQKNITVLNAEVIDIDAEHQKVMVRNGEIYYDTLIVATGVSHHYFGHDEWAEVAPGLKTIEDALNIRRRILMAFEAAEREPDPEKRRAWITFVVVGGGPTGLELAGALGEMTHTTLENDFQHIDPAKTQILLLEGMERVLPSYPAALSSKAEASLIDLGVTVRTGTQVTELQDGQVTLQHKGKTETIYAKTIVWAAGMKASGSGQVLADRTGVELDRAGRVLVEQDLTIKGYPNIMVLGDLAHFAHQTGQPLPSVAPVAMQQGKYAARRIKQQLKGKTVPAFRYFNKGNLAVIGRNAAVADLGVVKFSGFLAWLAWVFVHIWYLIEFDNKLMVMFQWAYNYFTRRRGARLITGDDPVPPVSGVPADLAGDSDQDLSQKAGETNESEPQSYQTRPRSGVGVGLSAAASR